MRAQMKRPEAVLPAFFVFIARVSSEDSNYDRAKECKDKTNGQKMQLPHHGKLPIPRRRECGHLAAEFQATKMCCAAALFLEPMLEARVTSRFRKR